MIVKNDRCGILDGKEVGTDSELLGTRALLGLFYFNVQTHQSSRGDRLNIDSTA